MKILYLDKNILVDRRIDLFSMTLKALGHETRLLYLEPPQQFEERFNVDIEAIPISDKLNSDAAVARGIFSKPPHVLEVDHFLYGDKRGRQAEFEEFIVSSTEKFGKNSAMRFVVPMLTYPDLYRNRLKNVNLNGPLRFLLNICLSILSLPGKIKNLNKPKLDDYPVVSPTGVPLNYFDKACMRFAVEGWRPDIIVANDYPTLRAAATIKNLLGIPLIYDSHELYSYQPGVVLSEAKKIFAEEKKLLKYVDGMIMMNERHVEVVERDFNYTGNYTICTNATNRPNNFDPKIRYNKFREVLPIPDKHKIMLFQGGVNIERRIDFVLRGLAKARRSDVHMVFLTWGIEVDEFKLMAQQLGIASRVHFRPFVDWNDVLFYAASADCGIMPYQATDQNTSISSPNKMYEFIMAATPMIGSSDLYYVNKIVGGEGFGVVRPLRADVDYALAIEEMFDETKGGANRFRQALIEKSEKYSWDNEVKDSVGMYYKVFNSIKEKKADFSIKQKAKRIVVQNREEV